MKIFVDTDADTRLSRRIRRDSRARPRPRWRAESVRALRQPSFDAYCFPQRNYADVILPRGADNVAISMVENLGRSSSSTTASAPRFFRRRESSMVR